MTGWGEGFGDALGRIDGAVESAGKAVGHGVDRLTDGVGAGLDQLGAHGWADKVEDWGDAYASARGASVSEQRLGGTEQANELRSMIVKFTVRPGQGDPSGFDLGDMHWSGDLGEASSAGHTPDQGMMIYLSVPELLDSLGQLLARRSSNASFSGSDSPFGLNFRTIKKAVSVTGRSGPVARVGHAELALAVLSAAEELASDHLVSVPAQDHVTNDYQAALDRFRLAVRATQQG
ncbi:putative T7SS-secreted protein [Streptomyces subrutilus]|uniref:putative T7SS-secreted protein n=1 Tax=Streptomyces subrutilus TaxID=36818 RepID=UPI0033C25AD4